MHITKNQMIGGAVAAVVLLSASFWGGMSYAKSASTMRSGFSAAGGNAQFMMRGAGGTTMVRGGGLVAGEILSKDANGVTVKMQDGSTKLVLIGGSTQVLKQAEGSADDLSIGTMVTVTGSANGDGSVTAQSVQIRPAGMAAPAGGSVRTQAR
ncbi:MAG: hypothetical protein JWL87_137 [Candidatus Adlerbacteria bacterium]|nr:hypothetical protein [Candidatus Adlerbacteria bacterium]